MKVDQIIREAISNAVKQYDQSPTLTTKLIAWMNAVIDGKEESLHIDVVFDQTKPLDEGEIEEIELVDRIFRN